ncbi:MAG: hypothetical protein A2252_04205 [Elusimicrobia bacterium RIFOXYA2_FULL_39_19]|nr:MAG: hypothetical protein A2252_04205 [Elusimicrobia bacterium RIFOXYA2_FULL_39_19]
MIYQQEFIDYLHSKGTTAKTIKYKKLYLDQFFDWLDELGIHKPDSIRPSTLEKYKIRLYCRTSQVTKQRLDERTIFAKMYVVKEYFGYLKSHDRILLNPAYNLEMPRPKEKLPKDVPSVSEILALLNKPNISTLVGIRDRAMLELLYSSALRRQELVNLNVYDIDFRESMLRVNKGKGGKDRLVPFGANARHWLEQYLREVRTKWLDKKNEPALFLTVSGGRMNPVTLYYNIKKYTLLLFPGRKIATHTLRHCCATHLLKDGANLRIIQQLLAHNSLKTTQIYTRVTPIDLKAAHRKCFRKKRDKKRIRGNTGKGVARLYEMKPDK